MNGPQFSIIVPVYKTEAYIRQCLDSIRTQSYGNFEVVLVDDGSPDGCGAICDEYAAMDTRFRVIHKENGGLVSARKAGTAICTGDYIVNVDSDDYIADDLLQQLTEIIAEYEPDVVCYDGWRFGEQGQSSLAGTAVPGLYTDDKLEALRNLFIRDKDYRAVVLVTIWSKAVKRALYMQYQSKVPDALTFGEDLAVTGPLLTHCESVYLSGVLGYYYRMNPKSIMHTFRKEEVVQIELLARHLKAGMREADHGRIDGYVLMRYFGFLHHLAWVSGGYRAYRAVAEETANEYVDECVRRADAAGSGMKAALVYFLTKRRTYWPIWLLSHLKERE